jgi:hypothetical protein
MSTDDRLSAGQTHTLRWLAVLPAAILAGWLAHLVFGTASVVVARLVWQSYVVRLLLYYVPKDAAFVLVGAKVAPRPRATAVVLAAAAIAMSLAVHILGQRTVGVTNYLHFAAESVGAVLGAAFTFSAARRRVTEPDPARGTLPTAASADQKAPVTVGRKACTGDNCRPSTNAPGAFGR